MKTQVILIDWENVQPELLPSLDLAHTRVLVFIGPHQTKLPFPTVEAVQKLGERAEYVRVSKQGPDALDMHIAFYLGRISKEIEDVYFHVIAKDRDYDPLIAHLKALKIGAAKWHDLASIPILKRAAARTLKEQTSATRDWLLERKGNRPKTLKTLTNSLKTSAFAGRLSDEEIELLLAELKEKNLINVQGQKVEYPGTLDA
jgi:PIN domain